MEDKDLEEMRAQIAILKEKLDKETIVNDKLMQNSMKEKVGVVNSMAIRQYACALLAIVLIIMNKYMIGLSWIFVIATILLMLFTIYKTWRMNRPLNERNLFSNDVATASKEVRRVIHDYHLWLYYYTPVILTPWILWFCYEYMEATHAEGRTFWTYCGIILVSAIIGFLIGLKWHQKAVNACQDIADQLNGE